MKRISLILTFFMLIASLGCGSSGGDSSSSQNDEPTLAEVSANLPKTGTINVGSENDSNQGESQGNSNAPGNSQATTPNQPNSSSSISFSMRRFLWKPISEGDGNVVVLVDPIGVRVEVFGSISETLNDFGPSNERGTTARGSFPGCRYGSGIQLRFYSRNGQQLGFVDGRATINVSDGCQRIEFNL